MKRTKQRLGVYSALILLLSAVSVSLYTLALLWDFNYTTGYFKDSLLATVAEWTVLGGVLLAASFSIVGRTQPLKASFSSPAFYLPSGLVGVALCFLSAEHFKTVFGAMAENAALGFSIFSADLTLPLAVALFALGSIGYFIVGTLAEDRRSVIRGAFGIVAAVFLSLYAAYLYFDTTLPINAPTKVLSEMAYIFSSVFFLFETRVSLGRDRWSGYLSFGMAATVLTATASIPALIVYFVNGSLITHSLSEAVLTLALFVFTLLRVLHAATLRADRQSPLAVMSDIMTEDKAETTEGALDEENGDEDPDNYTMTFDEDEAK